MAARTRNNPMTDLALVAVFAALIAAFSVVPGIAVPGSTVPITLQTLAIGLTAMVLGARRAFLATLLYVLVGLAGLPVFANGASGIGVLSRPSAGYLVSFPLYAALVGALSVLVLRRGLRYAPIGLTVSGLVGSVLLVHPLGIIGLMRALHIPFAKAWAIDVVYWPGDIAKTIVAALIAVAVHRAFPALVRASVRRTVAAS